MKITPTIRKIPGYEGVIHDLIHGVNVAGLQLPRGARLPFLATLAEDIEGPIVLVTDRADHAATLIEELPFWLSDKPIYYFSEPNPLFYEDAVWGDVTRQERLQALAVLANYHLPEFRSVSSHPIIILSARALMTRTLPRREFIKATRKVEVGSSIHQEVLIRGCIECGYESSQLVIEPGTISRRGGLIDIWPPSEKYPVRIEFFGNELETIRFFDPGTQRTKDQINSIQITPAREYLVPGISSSLESRTFTEFHIPMLHPYSSCLLDYLPKRSIVVYDDISSVENSILEIEEQSTKQRLEAIEAGTLDADFPIPYYSWSEINDLMSKHVWVDFGFSSVDIGEDTIPEQSHLGSAFGQLERFNGRLKNFIDSLGQLIRKSSTVLVVTRQAARIRELWEERQGENLEKDVDFVEFSLSAGWVLGDLYLFTDSEIFGWERPKSRSKHPVKSETPETAYADFSPGDWIVHSDYGIGQYMGLVKRILDTIEHEFLCIEYQNQDQVFVPVHQADRLTRYIGPHGEVPAAGRLGSKEWQETKTRVKLSVQEVAQDMLDLYARRKVARGFSFSADTQWQNELESSFPYMETPDQKKALVDIKSDMESIRPMDRLLCGDVGYGKTEVALRSAFKAVMDGKQVAVLVPTTVLAQQHYDTFIQRLSAYPVNIEMLSRFRSPREQADIIRRLKNGTLDIVVGTHRLISSDVQFKDLGLVIIDEEQRFGVNHKEHLKRLRTELDILTLTATPIPRTLYMALTGVRDISSLNTPPEERLPIVTHIGPYSPRIVRMATLRELERGGQIFFVHNRVQTINGMKMHLEKLVPEARIAVAHGQMQESILAEVMHNFTSGDIDILLSTSIIESGLDIPNANTLIVDRADAFGLAQLYQLRGRVGRGAARAYAYFFKHRKIRPTLDGQERLEVIAENSQLGAGFSIAMRDLEMRGAGELLGTRQSGQIAAIGFHLYTRLLGFAIRKLRQRDKVGSHENEGHMEIEEFNLPVNVDLPIALGIPETYVPDQSLRLQLYRRLANLTDDASLEAISDELCDRFGQFPDQVKNLIFLMKVKIKASKAEIAQVSTESGQLVLRYASAGEKDAGHRLPDLEPSVRGGKNTYWCTFLNAPAWQEKLLVVLDKLKKTEE